MIYQRKKKWGNLYFGQLSTLDGIYLILMEFTPIIEKIVTSISLKVWSLIFGNGHDKS